MVNSNIAIKFLNIQTPEKIAAIILKFERCGSYHRIMSPKDADEMANSVDPDQTAPDLGLHCLPRPVRIIMVVTDQGCYAFYKIVHLSQLMRLWYLSHWRPAKAQASLHIRAVSPEPTLFAHMKYGSR